jgi:CobQ-like glutamine amidotransferase family enzyme
MNKNANKIMVGHINIEATASDEDPYGQGGFSVVNATIITTDRKEADAFKAAYTTKSVITVRCGGLELDGKVFRFARRLTNFTVVLNVEDVRWRIGR